eukprot:SAG25_NODE_236_length_11287_cov_246.398999_11_plen_233_part_00
MPARRLNIPPYRDRAQETEEHGPSVTTKTTLCRVSPHVRGLLLAAEGRVGQAGQHGGVGAIPPTPLRDPAPARVTVTVTVAPHMQMSVKLPDDATLVTLAPHSQVCHRHISVKLHRTQARHRHSPAHLVVPTQPWRRRRRSCWCPQVSPWMWCLGAGAEPACSSLDGADEPSAAAPAPRPTPSSASSNTCAVASTIAPCGSLASAAAVRRGSSSSLSGRVYPQYFVATTGVT